MSDTPLTDAFIAALPPVNLSNDVVTAAHSVRALMVDYADFARQLERGNAELREALEKEQEWRDRDAAGALDEGWDYETMVGQYRRAALAAQSATVAEKE